MNLVVANGLLTLSNLVDDDIVSVVSVVVVIAILSSTAVLSIFFTEVIIEILLVLLIDILLVSVMTEGEIGVTLESVAELVWWMKLDDGLCSTVGGNRIIYVVKPITYQSQLSQEEFP